MTIADAGHGLVRRVCPCRLRYLDDENNIGLKERIRDRLEIGDHCLGQYNLDGAFLGTRHVNAMPTAMSPHVADIERAMTATSLLDRR